MFQVPYADSDDAGVRAAVIAGDRLPIPDDVPREFAQLITDCWAQDPIKRPAMIDVVRRLEAMQSRLTVSMPAPSMFMFMFSCLVRSLIAKFGAHRRR